MGGYSDLFCIAKIIVLAQKVSALRHKRSFFNANIVAPGLF
jgi:hypothetical protein